MKKKKEKLKKQRKLIPLTPEQEELHKKKLKALIEKAGREVTDSDVDWTTEDWEDFYKKNGLWDCLPDNPLGL